MSLPIPAKPEISSLLHRPLVLDYYSMKKTIFTAIRITVSIALILVLLYIMRDKYGQILAVLKGTDPVLFGLAAFVYMGALIVASVRLRLIAKVQAISITFPEAASLTYIGYFFNNFLPTAIGGDIVKAFYLSKKTADRTSAYTSVFIDRAIGLITMIFMAFVALFFVGTGIVDASVRNIIYAITALSAVSVVILSNANIARRFSGVLKFLGPLEKQLVKAYYAIHSYRHHTLLMIKAFTISILSQLLFFATMGILALSIGARISTLNILLRMPVVGMMSLLPSINGLGVREGSTVLVFSPLIGKANAFAVSILVVATLLIMSIIGGLVYALSPQFKIKLKEINEEAA